MLSRIRVAIAAGITATLLVGCAGTAPKQSSSANAGTTTKAAAFDRTKKYEIVFESYNLGSDTWSPTILDLIQKFEKKYPNVDVKPQAPDTTTAGATAPSVQRQLLAGNPPDVVQMTFDTLNFAVSDLRAQPLNQLFGQNAVDEHLNGKYPMHPKVKDFGVMNGNTYGIPYVLSTPMLWYNKTMLAEAGIKNPDFSTWESTFEISSKITKKTQKPSLSISCLDPIGEWCLQGIVRSNGGRVLSEDGKTIQIGDEAAVDALSKISDAHKSGILENSDFWTQSESFTKQSTAIHIDSASMQMSYQRGADSGKWELGATGLPAFGEKPVVPTSSGSALMMFSQDSDKAAAAWEFMKFMTSDVAYQEISPKIGYLPLRTTMTNADGPLADWASKNKLLEPNMKQLQAIEPWVSYPGASYSKISTAIMDGVFDVVYEGAEPKKTLGEAAAKAQEMVP